MQKTNSITPQLKMLLLFVIILMTYACSNEINDLPTNQLSKISASAISLNNQGVGEMGKFDYAKATETFKKLIIENKDWALAQQNLSIALLNRQNPGDEEQSINIVKELLRINPKNLVAQYIVAILKFNQGLCEEALPLFESIIKSDPTDAYALYFAGQCHLQNGEAEPALALYEKAIKVDGYLRSAYYGSFMAAQRLAKTETAKQMLEGYQKLASNPKARLAEIKYTRMGPKAIAQVISNQNKTPIMSPNAPFFQTPQLLKNFQNVEQFGIVNLDQNKTPQLYIINENKLNLYSDFLFQPSKLENLTITLNSGKHLLAWGDINNDSKIDVYVTGATDQLYLQSMNGFEAVDMINFGLNQLSSSAVRMVDADHDGDLDLLVLSQKGHFEIYNNNLNNSFTALSKHTGLTTENGYKNILIQDIDADRDADIILANTHHLTVLLNDRMWDYEKINSQEYQSGLLSLSFSDNDLNGIPELNTTLGNGHISSLEFNRQISSLQEIQSIDNFNSRKTLQIDVNGNAQQEYLVLSNDGIDIYNEKNELIEKVLLSGIEKIKTLETKAGPELLILKNKQLYYIPASNNRMPFVLLDFSGKEDDANSVRSNYSGIGTSVVLQNEGFYSTANTFQNGSGLDQDYQSISLAAGIKPRLDFIALEWSDGVYQTELGLQGNSYHRITETQRQLSSCPVIFAWNDGRYEFISDVLGVGGIGFAIGRHEYGIPRPWENYLLTSEQLKSENGMFKLQFTEPMEESAYLDALQIEVMDVPKAWSVTLDERMAISSPKVTGKPLFYLSVIHPIQVLDKVGNDVTQQIIETDKKAIEIINHDSRFLGLVDEQIITMKFSEGLQGDYQLLIDGWVEYGYSQTMFAAWQAGQIAQAPTLEYKANGQWKVLLKEFGYPAGMPRAASVPISLPEETHFLRIRTNMEIYFDQLGLIQPSQPKTIHKYALQLQSAELKQLGFPKRENNNQRVPSYDFSKIQPFWDTRYMLGAYTQLGIITELLVQQDNALAIIGAGEGIELKFKDDLPQLEQDHQRYYVLKFKGWAKDMDILTKNGETLAPIPADGNLSRHAKNLNSRYNNRFKAGK